MPTASNLLCSVEDRFKSNHGMRINTYKSFFPEENEIGKFRKYIHYKQRNLQYKHFLPKGCRRLVFEFDQHLDNYGNKNCLYREIQILNNIKRRDIGDGCTEMQNHCKRKDYSIMCWGNHRSRYPLKNICRVHFLNPSAESII